MKPCRLFVANGRFFPLYIKHSFAHYNFFAYLSIDK